MSKNSLRNINWGLNENNHANQKAPLAYKKFVCKINYQNLLLFLHPLKWHQFVTLVEKRWICLKSWFEEIFLILLNCCWQKICCQISSQFESRIAVRGGIEVWKVCWSLMKKQGIFVKNMFTKDIIVLFTIQ